MVMNHQQNAFHKRKSTTANLLESVYDWSLALDNKDGISDGL